MKVKIISISDSDKHFSSAILEYLKRMWKTIELINIKPVKHWTKAQIIEKETNKIIEYLSKRNKNNDLNFLMSINWKSYSTEELTGTFNTGKNYNIIIWWPYGLNEKILWSYIDHRIWFWSHTMPHGLAKLVLLEQVYRISMIQQWKSYHY